VPFGKSGLRAKKTVSKLAEHELLDYALRALSVKAFSEQELRKKLKTRAAFETDIDLVVAKLNEYGYVDDRRFASVVAASRRDNEGFGKERVLRDLRQRNVSSNVAETAVAETYAEVDEIEQIRSFLSRKFRGKDLPTYLKEQKNLANAYRRLRYAGFSHTRVVHVLKSLASGKEEFLEQLDEPDPVEE
jgi:regulatory protein